MATQPKARSRDDEMRDDLENFAKERKNLQDRIDELDRKIFAIDVYFKAMNGDLKLAPPEPEPEPEPEVIKAPRAPRKQSGDRKPTQGDMIIKALAERDGQESAELKDLLGFNVSPVMTKLKGQKLVEPRDGKWFLVRTQQEQPAASEDA